MDFELYAALISKFRAVEYTDCFSAEGKTPPPIIVLVIDTKQSDGEAPVML